MTASRSMPAARGRRAGGGGGGRLRVAGRSSRIGIGSGSGDVDDAAGIAVRLVHRLLGPPAALLHSTIGRRPVLDDRSASTAAFGANTSDDAQSARLQARRIGELAPRTGRRRWSLVAGMAAVAQRAARDARIDGTGPRRRGGGRKANSRSGWPRVGAASDKQKLETTRRDGGFEGAVRERHRRPREKTFGADDANRSCGPRRRRRRRTRESQR